MAVNKVLYHPNERKKKEWQEWNGFRKVLEIERKKKTKRKKKERKKNYVNSKRNWIFFVVGKQ